MDAFEQELLRRSPLAAAVLEAFEFSFEPQLLGRIWEQHRGRCYEDELSFQDMLRLMREALIRHDGSAHKLFVELEDRGQEPVDESNFYRKLANTPVQVTRALLRECTARLGQLMPQPPATRAACFDGFELIIGDGKKIKNATKRLKPSRPYSGKLLGAKALVAVNARTGLAIAMSDSLDGLSNDVPLVPELLRQLQELIERPILSIWDRQFDGLRTLEHLSAREGDAFVVRMAQLHTPFAVESVVESTDEQGRRIRDEIGMLGRKKTARRLRRITLFRDADQGQEDVVLLTNLLDREAYPADDLLGLYRCRWGIEQVFQQVTETFSLQHLIGCQPKAILLQFSFCLLLYNLMQLIKAYVAEDGQVLASVVSMFYLFDDARMQLTAWAYHGTGCWEPTAREAGQMRSRLRQLLKGSWRPKKYTKASDKKPRGRPQPKLRLHGGHSSVLRTLEGRARVVQQ